MAAFDNTYSRVVFWLKLILPLVALAGLSTLFLVARTIDPAQSIPYSDVDIDALTKEQRIGAPTFSGVTGSGAAFRLSADRAWPDSNASETLRGADIRAEIDLPNGTGVTVNAQSAVFSNESRTAGLSDEIRVETSQGYRLEANRLSMALDTLRLWSDEAVRVTGPGLELSAGRFDITGDGSAARPHVLVFKDRVSLLYHP